MIALAALWVCLLGLAALVLWWVWIELEARDEWRAVEEHGEAMNAIQRGAAR